MSRFGKAVRRVGPAIPEVGNQTDRLESFLEFLFKMLAKFDDVNDYDTEQSCGWSPGAPMVSPMSFARSRAMFLAMLAGTAASWVTPAAAQDAAPLLPSPPAAVSPAAADCKDLVERLGKMEQRLDWLTRQNNDLLRQNKLLTAKSEAPFRDISDPSWSGTGPTDPNRSGPSRAGVPGPLVVIGQPGTGSQSEGFGSASQDLFGSTTGGGSDSAAGSTGGGRSVSAAGGGDPTAIGRAQEVGNLHLGQVPLNAHYDFDNGGFHLETTDKEFSIGVSGMTQIDGMLYSRPTPGTVTSSGFYNPRSRIYFEGHATEPISWEFSFQNFFDTVQLLDAYVNLNYDPRFQVQIGRYKNPFGYEFYRMHIWDLMEPERSLWAVNYEANRRFGLMAHGVLLDERVEYALGSFDSQRNSFRPFNSRQDFEAFLNFKPFYPEGEDFLLRNLQFGGSVDLGNENQSLTPAVLRTNFSPGPATIDSTVASNAAELPFLAFGPNVLERGTRDLWEAHLAYYYGGFSLASALEGGHESYANGVAAPVHVPVNGWFVQGGYILTGETIRDRTLLQPLHPFDLRPCRFGLGAWEVTTRYSQLELGSEVFTAGLADPHLWSNRAKMVDVGLNWYLNQFVKVYFDWEHAFFGSPVTATGGAFRTSNDLFWVRTQVYF
jgi:phosphate-selective porin OprO/OprP